MNRQINYAIIGSGLHADDLKGLLNKSYEKTPTDYKDFVVDKELSGQRVQVYYNKKTNQVIVAHRGTAGIVDWLTDLRTSLFNDTSNKRFDYSKNQQKKAYEKYSALNPDVKFVTIGHSLGAKLAKHASDGKDEIITLNGLSTPFDALTKTHNHNPNQLDIRTSYDIPSILNTNKNKIILKERKNPLDILGNHSINTLDELGNKYVGKGIKKIKGAGTVFGMFSNRNRHVAPEGIIHHVAPDPIPNPTPTEIADAYAELFDMLQEYYDFDTNNTSEFNADISRIRAINRIFINLHNHINNGEPLTNETRRYAHSQDFETASNHDIANSDRVSSSSEHSSANSTRPASSVEGNGLKKNGRKKKRTNK